MLTESGRCRLGLPTLRAIAMKDGGEEEIRTLDPHVANVMLYQLSYFPFAKNGAKYIKSRTQKQEACDYFFARAVNQPKSVLSE